MLIFQLSLEALDGAKSDMICSGGGSRRTVAMLLLRFKGMSEAGSCDSEPVETKVRSCGSALLVALEAARRISHGPAMKGRLYGKGGGCCSVLEVLLLLLLLLLLDEVFERLEPSDDVWFRIEQKRATRSNGSMCRGIDGSE